jgi:hypothetical protein
MMSLEQSEPRGGSWGDRQGLGYTRLPGRCGFRSEDNAEPREDLEQRRVRSYPLSTCTWDSASTLQLLCVGMVVTPLHPNHLPQASSTQNSDFC